MKNLKIKAFLLRIYKFVIKIFAPKTLGCSYTQIDKKPLLLKATPMQQANATYTLRIDITNPNKEKLNRLPPPVRPYSLRLEWPEGCYQCSDGCTLYTNYPISGSFSRADFHQLNFKEDLSCGLTKCEFLVEHPGIYEFYFKFKHISTNENITSETNYFLVDPILKTKQNAAVKIEDLSLITIIPNNIKRDGVDNWFKTIDDIKRCGYNLIHFVPIQQMGNSNSPYSIADQLKLDDRLFAESSSDGFKDLDNVLNRMSENGTMKLIDLVWNHTSVDSSWLKKHPEAAYNLKNSKHLRPAYVVDLLFKNLNKELVNEGFQVVTECHMQDLISRIKQRISDAKLYKYFVIDIEKSKTQMLDYIYKNEFDSDAAQQIPIPDNKHLVDFITQTPSFYDCSDKYNKVLNPLQMLRIICQLNSINTHDAKGCSDKIEKQYENLINKINVFYYSEYDNIVKDIVKNTDNHLRYSCLADDGPKNNTFVQNNHIFPSYFTVLKDGEEQNFESEYIVAHNGWIWGNSSVDFASDQSDAYLKREVIAWEDCVKLNYAEKYADSNFLWDHMKTYTESMASRFNGIRIDNCHSTPIHVAKFLIDCARKANPNIIIVAELFTGSQYLDSKYVNSLGIHTLIREAMQPHSSFELSRLTYMYGGAVDYPLGSFEQRKSIFDSYENLESEVKRIKSTFPPALFMDCTHDNETPFQKRTIKDTLSNAAIVCMCNSAIGSVKGYDELYPYHIVFGKHSQLAYKEPDDIYLNGIAKAKAKLNELHAIMQIERCFETYVHHEKQIIIIHRQSSETHEGYLLIAHTSFKNENEGKAITPIKLSFTEAELYCAFDLEMNENVQPKEYTEIIEGIEGTLKEYKDVGIDKITENGETYSQIDLNKISWFDRGSIIVLKTKIIDFDKHGLNDLLRKSNEEINKLDSSHLNVMLYRSDAEERDFIGSTHGSYNVPNHGNLVYCGLQGFESVLSKVVEENDLGNPICDHLRKGIWAFEYIVDRLKLYQEQKFDGFQSLIPYLENITNWLKSIPKYLVPKYFAKVVLELYSNCIHRGLNIMNVLVEKKNSPFVNILSMCSIKLNGTVKSAGLCPQKGIVTNSLAAGLPHFSTDYMRCWGRDIFISITGLFMCTGQFDQAKKHILAFASTVNHGLVPNLLDSLRNPRYNSRDSVWWFLQAIQNYVCITNDLSILQEQVKRRHPQKIDEHVSFDDLRAFNESYTLSEIIFEIMQKHANGIHFREHNAGPNLDAHMKDEGFNIDINFDTNTGFISGGNEFNCGTWMDKMGESERAGTKGIPATPRNGANVEIIGLLKSTTRWLSSICGTAEFPYSKVQLPDNEELSFSQWDQLIQQNFEKYFYIPNENENQDGYEINPELVHRRGIYKDIHGSTKEFSDYQFRPNFFVAMAVAPELFNEKHALSALELASQILVSSLGMKTLDLKDWQYRPNYDNSYDGDDRSIAKGFNYHSGPEWGWPIGYYIRAYHKFNKKSDNVKTNKMCHFYLRHIKDYIKNNVYRGIPELTNENGAYCKDSCTSQAWSMATILEALYQINSDL